MSKASGQNGQRPGSRQSVFVRERGERVCETESVFGRVIYRACVREREERVCETESVRERVRARVRVRVRVCVRE